MNNSVQLPDGPFNPTNYSGTQVNFWGVSPGNVPPLVGGVLASPYDTAGQLGVVTNTILQVLMCTIKFSHRSSITSLCIYVRAWVLLPMYYVVAFKTRVVAS
jgi:hypothetical protein